MKLYFIYGTMQSSKSLELLRIAHEYQNRGLDILLFKPSIDTREGTEKCIIKSRAGLSKNASWVCPYDNIFLNVHREIERNNRNISIVLVDECQFLNERQISELSDIVDILNIPVMAFGLRTNFQSYLFEGSKRLMELADEIRECRAIDFDGRKAIMNARVINGHIVYNGEEVQIGGNESYQAVTRKNWKNGVIK